MKETKLMETCHCHQNKKKSRMYFFLLSRFYFKSSKGGIKHGSTMDSHALVLISLILFHSVYCTKGLNDWQHGTELNQAFQDKKQTRSRQRKSSNDYKKIQSRVTLKGTPRRTVWLGFFKGQITNWVFALLLFHTLWPNTGVHVDDNLPTTRNRTLYLATGIGWSVWQNG